ncbi:hypothetical protein chiPu_0014528 [Chiloscyllium punctatum]|uniref:Uncharacterized protein n=1 Tax=Chiloscyllium punctatum TaxID=137246 RepID=A0A401T085_CHIPU|nr:hypothetical protein [Chiloscyllium punctatum]
MGRSWTVPHPPAPGQGFCEISQLVPDRVASAVSKQPHNCVDQRERERVCVCMSRAVCPQSEAAELSDLVPS